MKTTLLKFLFISSAIAVLSGCLPTQGVQAPAGNFIGASDTAFLGIPYAVAPTGYFRWRAPVTKPSMGTTPYYASFKRPGCTQGSGFTGVFYTSEDCLYLNIWRPADHSTPSPVMVYIHGGSGDIGSGGEFQYEGRMLSAFYGVTVVTINARLGMMGFLSIKDFEDEGFFDDGVSHAGNYGYLDQLKALEWVHDNISAFGGDPNNVTLFGESAGAISTCYHLASPLSNTSGYFHKAIIQSGSCEFATRSQALANTQGQNYSQNVLGCSPLFFVGDGTTAECLRSKSAQQLYGAELAANPNGNALSFNRLLPLLNAVDDNYFLQGGTSGTVRESLQTHGNPAIPVIIGANQDEGTLLNAFSVPTVQTSAQYDSFLTTNYTAVGDVPALNALYPVENYRIPINAVSDVVGDMIFPCAARRTADTLQEAGHDVYFYELKEPVITPFIASYVTVYNKGLGPDLGVFHSSDIPFVFGMNSVLGDANKPATMPTMNMIQEYWTNFAKNGVPTSATAQALGVASWPQYISPANAGTREYMQLRSIAPSSASELKQAKCDYWETYQDPVYFDVH